MLLNLTENGFFSFYEKRSVAQNMQKMCLWRGFAPDPTGELTTPLPDPTPLGAFGAWTVRVYPLDIISGYATARNGGNLQCTATYMAT